MGGIFSSASPGSPTFGDSSTPASGRNHNTPRSPARRLSARGSVRSRIPCVARASSPRRPQPVGWAWVSRPTRCGMSPRPPRRSALGRVLSTRQAWCEPSLGPGASEPLRLPHSGFSESRVPGSGVRGRGSGERETTASSLAGKEESSRKEDNGGQGKDGPAGAVAQGGNGR